MENHTLFILLALIACLCFSCSDDDIPASAISRCCEADALIETFPTGNDSIPTGSIYVPNIFTPNGDGWNDVFPIYVEGVASLNSFLVTLNGVEVYFTEGFPPNLFFQFWDGSKDGIFVSNGIYDYQIMVTTIGGLQQTFSGKVALLNSCIFDGPYDSTGSLGNCKFPAQHDGAGGFDGNLPILDDELLEDCFN